MKRTEDWCTLCKFAKEIGIVPICESKVSDSSKLDEDGKCRAFMQKEGLFTLKDLISHKDFNKFIIDFAKKVKRIDQEAKVYLIGGFLEKGFSNGDLDLLIISENKLWKDFIELRGRVMFTNIYGTNKRDWNHDAMEIEDFPIDLYIYDKETLRNRSRKEQLSKELKQGYFRLRVI